MFSVQFTLTRLVQLKKKISFQGRPGRDSQTKETQRYRHKENQSTSHKHDEFQLERNYQGVG